ncbi:MAG: FHA domain-containing protein [Desulfobacterales bacterium]|nr:FHA domain-containing protein [Desulfobacterales bacterium]
MVSFIALEIHDGGILCTDAEGRLCPTETEALESPGYALVIDRKLLVGTAAYHQARRHPRQVNSRFWEAFDDQPLRSPEFEGYSHAELAYRHLEQVWRQVQADPAEVIFLVPDHYADKELGLLLGLASTLGMPVRGLISQALAGNPPQARPWMDFHVDLHLHRLVLTAVDGRTRPCVCRHATIVDRGREAIHREWVRMLADAFVRQTRFDPLYAADTEQSLYDRLPGIVDAEEHPDPIQVEMQADGRTHRIQIEREALTTPYAPWIDDLEETIAAWQQTLSAPPEASRLLITHRAAALPGFVTRLEKATGLNARRLAVGAAGANAGAFAGLLTEGNTAHGVPLLKRIPGQTAETRPAAAGTKTADTSAAPTHLVYRGWAYPITEAPLAVGRELPAGDRGIRVRGQLAGISRQHFSVRRANRKVLLTDTSSYGTRLDDVPVTGTAVLAVGQVIRIGTPGETLQAIACLADHETTIT